LPGSAAAFPPRCAVKQRHNFLHLFVELAHPGGLFFVPISSSTVMPKESAIFLRLDILGKAPFFQLVGIEFEKTSSSAAAGFSPTPSC
jgi:hypothetical protein